MVKQTIQLGGLLILIGGVAFYFYLRYAPPPEQVKVYKVPKRSPKWGASVGVLSTHPPQNMYSDPVPVHEIHKSSLFDPDESVAPWVIEQFNQLNVWFQETYPDLTEVSTMSPEDFLEAYPTDEAQEAFQERARFAQSVLFGRLRDLLAEVSPSVTEEALSIAKEHFTTIWGAETADMVLTKLRAELDL